MLSSKTVIRTHDLCFLKLAALFMTHIVARANRIRIKMTPLLVSLKLSNASQAVYSAVISIISDKSKRITYDHPLKWTALFQKGESS